MSFGTTSTNPFGVAGAAVVFIGLSASTALATGPIFTPVYTHPDAAQPDPEPTCSKTKVSPAIATDGDRIYVDGNAGVQRDMQVLVTGYRYNDSPPRQFFPQGEGREEIYCGCQRIKVETAFDDEFGSRLYIRVPDDAPPGDYSLEILPASVSCDSGGIRATCSVSESCIDPSLTVTRSYVVSTMERLDINYNSEDDDDNPAEMKFVFASGSGTAFGSGEHLVEFSGAFPGGGDRSSHLTNADFTSVTARLPLFAGEESKMNVNECREECVGLDDSREAACVSQCDFNEDNARYNNRLDIGFSGIERDESPSALWGVAGGVVAAALTCVGGAQLGYPCTGLTGSGGAIGIGSAASLAINELLRDDDDDLGSVAVAATYSNDWNIGTNIGPVKLSGAGDIDLTYRNRRVAAPLILDYNVRLKSVTLDDDYEENDCGNPNEVYINARASVHQGQTGLSGTVRIPANGGLRSMEVDDVWNFGSMEGSLTSASLQAENAPNVPFIYLEAGVWEDDGSDHDGDLMGIASDTIFLGQYISTYMDASDSLTSEGYFTRHATFTRTISVKGFAGSDNHCWGIWAHGWDPQANEGGATVTFEIDVTWMKTPVN